MAQFINSQRRTLCVLNKFNGYKQKNNRYELNQNIIKKITEYLETPVNNNNTIKMTPTIISPTIISKMQPLINQDNIHRIFNILFAMPNKCKNIIMDKTEKLIIALSDKGIYVSNNGFKTFTNNDFNCKNIIWNTMSSSDDQTTIVTSLLHNSNNMYNSSIYVSHDKGNKWTNTFTTNKNCYIVSMCSSNNGKYLIALSTNGVIYSSENYGANDLWVTNSCLENNECKKIILNNTCEKLLILSKNSVYLSNNYCKTFNKTFNKIFNLTVNLIDITASKNMNYIGIITNSGTFYLSSDFGKTWQNIDLPFCKQLSLLTCDELGSNFIMTTHTNDIWMYCVNNSNWQKINTDNINTLDKENPESLGNYSKRFSSILYKNNKIYVCCLNITYVMSL